MPKDKDKKPDNENEVIEDDLTDSVNETKLNDDNSEDTNISQTVSDIVSDVQPVVEIPQTPEAALAPEARPPESIAEKIPVDKDGNSFNPQIHMTDSEGKPKLTKGGLLRMKPGGAAKVREKILSQTPDLSEAEREQKLENSYRASGATAAQMTFTVFQLALGDEFRPIIAVESGINEPQLMTDAYTDYFRATDMPDIPPGWALAIALTGYVLPRFTMPKTQSKFKSIGAWFKLKFSRKRKAKVFSLKRGKNAQPDNRPDGQRENDIGKDDLPGTDKQGA